MSATETIRLAHTAQCKLQMAADRPDRNLRFILGHAFTLDKLRLRIAEIEMDRSDEEDLADELSEPVGATPRVSFRNNAARPSTPKRARSPPPDQLAHQGSDSDSFEDEDGREEDDEDDEGLSLQRFGSGSERRPPMVEDDGEGEEEEEEEIKTPPPLSEDELRKITDAEGDEELTEAYDHVAGCPCHGEHGPKASNVWEVPHMPDETGPRYAVVAVEA
jgi:hypothetical protein